MYVCMYVYTIGWFHMYTNSPDRRYISLSRLHKDGTLFVRWRRRHWWMCRRLQWWFLQGVVVVAVAVAVTTTMPHDHFVNDLTRHNDYRARSTLALVPAVSAWLPKSHRLCPPISLTTTTTATTTGRWIPVTVLYENKKKKGRSIHTSDRINNHNAHDRITSTTTFTALSSTKPPPPLPGQKEKYEALRRCTTVEDVLHLIECMDNMTIQLSSLVLVRLSKLYIQMKNHHIQQQQDGSVSIPITTTTNSTTMNPSSSISVLRKLMHQFIQMSITHTIDTFSNDISSIVSNRIVVDSIVDGTKACAVIARVMSQLPCYNQMDKSMFVDNDGSYFLFTKPLVEFYTEYGSKLIPFMQPHHLSTLKWALDCVLLMTPSTDDACDSINDTAPLPFPKSIHEAYTKLNLPFCILPQCLSMLDNHRIPISVDRIIRQVDFRTEEIYTTASGESVPERRLTAWQGDPHVAPFSYSGKVMQRNDWSPIVLHIRNQLYNITGQYYDGCLLNLYHSGKSGMRYHSDPDQGTLWDYDTAVVSIGASRRFVFRSISDTNQEQRQQQPHSFVVMDSDVTHMFQNCQTLYQHTLKNAEDQHETASRISLVFKRTYPYNNETILTV